MIEPRPISTRGRVEHTVRVLCCLIEDRVGDGLSHPKPEYDLRRELVTCILSSRVRYQTAQMATTNLAHAGLLDDGWWVHSNDDRWDTLATHVLSGRQPLLPHHVRHRFFRSRAQQLARARVALARVPLGPRIAGHANPKRLRRELVDDISGLGPKQASMFLRNTGTSYELAVLDSHVLRFMRMLELVPHGVARTATVAGYERTERELVHYARAIGHPVGYVDWAIWATMKAAQELRL